LSFPIFESIFKIYYLKNKKLFTINAYELKRDISNFSNKISVGLKRPKMKFLTQMIYGLLEGNKTHLS
jgi:hypothetical protein